VNKCTDVNPPGSRNQLGRKGSSGPLGLPLSGGPATQGCVPEDYACNGLSAVQRQSAAQRGFARRASAIHRACRSSMARAENVSLKHIAALTATVRKVSAQVEMSRHAPQTVVDNH
jgi:hypothetical protein